MIKPAVFFDRDGVLNKEIGYLYKIADFCWMDGAVEAIRYLNEHGFYVFVITNQSGIARGYYTEEDVLKLHHWMNEELAKYNARIDDFFYCPHYKDGIIPKYSISCDCRKPNTGMIEQAMRKYVIDKKNSYVIGDKDSDVKCAENAGIKGVIFQNENLEKIIKNIVGV